MRTHIALALAVFAVSCGDSPSSPNVAAPPDIRGLWAGFPALRAWEWTQTYPTAPTGSTSSTSCPGAIEITSQNGNAFTGRFSVECSAGRSAGLIQDGTVTGTGRISFRLAVQEGPDPAVPVAWGFAICRVTDPQTYEGSLTSANTMSANRVQFMDCPQGRIQVTAAFSGMHQ